MHLFYRQNLDYLECKKGFVMNTNFKTLKLEKLHEHVLLVTLNRPDVRNAMNIEMMQDLLSLWSVLFANQEGLRCIILTGAGEKAFCAGADLKERSKMNLNVWRQQYAVLQQAMLAMLDCPLPIIAAVNGAAFGGGLELTMASDFAYAAETAMFGQSEVKVGIMPGALGTQNLPRACGLRRAKELTFTGDAFSAQQAYEWGIINKVCAPEQLLQDVLATAIKIAENAPFAIRQAKRALNVSQSLDIKSGYAYEVEAYHRLLPTKDREEGIAAFNEKRKPKFIDE
jgi:enoyl-CoA hydratase